MWRALGVAVGISLAAITPGAALSLLQQWAPVVLLAATMLGGAVATAVLAYRKAVDNGRRLTVVERHIPKRSTDTPIGKPPTGAAATPQATIPGSGAASEIAGGHQEGDTP